MSTQTNFQAANGGKRALGKHAGFQSEEEQTATKPAHTPSTGENIIIAQTVIEAMMHGVVYFSLPLKRGCNLTAVYSDGTKETAEVKPETAQALRDYYAYANADGKKCECPSGFSLVSEIQSKRAN